MDDFSKETMNTFPNKNEAKWTANGKELKKEDSISSLLQQDQKEIKRHLLTTRKLLLVIFWLGIQTKRSSLMCWKYVVFLNLIYWK